VLGKHLKALIFDLDGTLYEQAPLRRAMLFRLVGAHLAHPLLGIATLRVLQSYRKAQELLRQRPSQSGDLAAEQLQLAGARLGLNAEAIAPCVARWMDGEPLPLLARCMRAGAAELLRKAKHCGLRLAVWSDYPAHRKLAALGIREMFDIVVTAQDPAVGRFKPDPAGLDLIISTLGIQRHEALYIGDRPEVDGLAASRAGVPYLNLTSGQTFEGLSELLARGVGA